MIIRHSLPHSSFTKVDRNVFTNLKLSDGACRLYGYLCGLRNGANLSDAYVMKAMNISQTVLTRRKRELKQEQLLLVDQISPRVYVAYIGYTGFTAESVKTSWLRETDEEY